MRIRYIFITSSSFSFRLLPFLLCCPGSTEEADQIARIRIHLHLLLFQTFLFLAFGFLRSPVKIGVWFLVPRKCMWCDPDLESIFPRKAETHFADSTTHEPWSANWKAMWASIAKQTNKTLHGEGIRRVLLVHPELPLNKPPQHTPRFSYTMRVVVGGDTVAGSPDSKFPASPSV